MQLNKEQCDRLTTLLSDKKIDIPDFRRSVTTKGGNFQWLQKNIKTRNPNINPEISKLLGLG